MPIKATPLKGVRVGPKPWRDRIAVSLRAAPLGLACALLPYALVNNGLPYLKPGQTSQSPPMVKIEHALTAVHASMIELPGQGDARAVAELASSARIFLLQDQQLTTAVQQLEAQYATLVERYEISLAEQRAKTDQTRSELRRLQDQQEAIAARLETTAVKADYAMILKESEQNPGIGERLLGGEAGLIELAADQLPSLSSAIGSHSSPDAGRSWASNTRLSALPSPITAAMQIARGLENTRTRAMLSKQEQTFTIDVERRLFGMDSDPELRELDPALYLVLDTASSETINEHIGRIRFFPDGSSTGGRIQLRHGSGGASADVDWSTGDVTVQVFGD